MTEQQELPLCLSTLAQRFHFEVVRAAQAQQDMAYAEEKLAEAEARLKDAEAQQRKLWQQMAELQHLAAA